MKLIYCPVCQDIVSLRFKEVRVCACGAVGGAYLDQICSLISQEAIPLEFDNKSYAHALRKRPAKGEEGCVFIASTMPEECARVVRLDYSGAPVLTDVHGIGTDSLELRNLLFNSMALTLELYRRTKDFHGSIARTPRHTGSDWK